MHSKIDTRLRKLEQQRLRAPANDWIAVKDDGSVTQFLYRGALAYEMPSDTGIDWGNVAEIPSDVLRGIVDGCEAVGVSCPTKMYVGFSPEDWD